MHTSSETPLVFQTHEEIGERGAVHIYGADPLRPRPFVIGIHGGGWQRGDQSSYRFIWPDIQSLDCALVLVSYRVAPEFRFPAAYDDLLHALAWLRENGGTHGLDTSRSLLFGSSAGGHLVMLLATRGIKEGCPMPQIKGVVQYCGIMDLSAQYAFDIAKGGGEASMTEVFLGGTPESCPGAYRDASPVCHLHDGLPPVWMAHGTADPTVSVHQSRTLVRDLKQAGCDPIYLEAFGLPHTMCEHAPDGSAETPPTLLFKPDMLRFIHRHLHG